MSKLHFFQKLAPMGVASLGAIAAIAGIGIAAAPAQAGTLEWDNGTSSFIDDVEFVAGNSFDVTFSPESLGGQAAVFIASDEFAPFFGPLPEFVALTPPPTGTFEFQDFFAPGIAEYQLTNDLVFNFDTDGNENASGNQVSVTIEQGTTFLGEFDLDTNGNILGIEFEEEVVAGVTTNIDGDIYTIGGDPFRVTGQQFTFGQATGSDGGGYQGSVVVSQGVPEPASILGLLAVGGLGIAMKRKQQSKQLSA